MLHKDSLTIMTIHGVMDCSAEAEWVPTRPQISTKQLKKSVELISKYYKFISLDKAVKMLGGEIPFEQHCVVITFDDGYRNNLTVAWPILKDSNVPAIMFPAVGHVQRRECFWFDRLDYAIQKSYEVGERYCQLGDKKIAIDGSDRKKLRESIKSVIFKIKELAGKDDEVMSLAEEAISDLERKSGKSLNMLVDSDPWCGVMSWDDLKEAHESGMDIGSHTVDHARIGLLDEKSVKWQLTESKRMIEDKIKQSCDYFCYPNGSYKESILDFVSDAGYKAALTTKEGINRLGDDVYQLKRVHMPQRYSPQEALAVASGLSCKLSVLLRKLRIKDAG